MSIIDPTNSTMNNKLYFVTYRLATYFDLCKGKEVINNGINVGEIALIFCVKNNIVN